MKEAILKNLLYSYHGLLSTKAHRILESCYLDFFNDYLILFSIKQNKDLCIIFNKSQTANKSEDAFNLMEFKFGNSDWHFHPLVFLTHIICDWGFQQSQFIVCNPND